MARAEIAATFSFMLTTAPQPLFDTSELLNPTSPTPGLTGEIFIFLPRMMKDASGPGRMHGGLLRRMRDPLRQTSCVH